MQITLRKLNAMKPNTLVVIFKSTLKLETKKAYQYYVLQMEDLVKKQPGYLGHVSLRNKNKLGLTLSYWENEEALLHWKQQAAHKEAQFEGRRQFYSSYSIEVAEINRSYSFP